MSKDNARIAAGLKAVVNNPRVSDEAKDRALRRLDGLDRVSRSRSSPSSSAPVSGSSSRHRDQEVNTSDSHRKLTKRRPAESSTRHNPVEHDHNTHRRAHSRHAHDSDRAPTHDSHRRGRHDESRNQSTHRVDRGASHERHVNFVDEEQAAKLLDRYRAAVRNPHTPRVSKERARQRLEFHCEAT